MLLEVLEAHIDEDVRVALEEDVGQGDITAQLIPEHGSWKASIYSREHAILCGRNWFDAVFHHLDENIDLRWYAADGDSIAPHQAICTLKGPPRSLLTGERTALNFLQTLSGTATLAHQYAQEVKGLDTRILDTRKTIPGLRRAQKYAVRTGGCHNHRMGLYDAFLIKENHIAAAGSIAAAIDNARALDHGLPIEVEVETLDELQQALKTGVDRVMLDNFSIEDIRKGVVLNAGTVELEASGNITLSKLREYAETGVDYISIGALTKDVKAIDLSMRFD
ncbi:Quinolinate phosphoribosyltransferase [decarboxylating] [hydrothermal vent metagenome]|uniref:Probable nicotinate-nucleotide pyrophosphorylase [carboxylating] n=1 Tax=hydrothermal vent metagenome TaxID=652676 RepID=A0A3B0YD62_9ZZZZ